MGILQQASAAFVLATADDEMQDRWIPDEEWVRHIRSKEYFKPCQVNSLNAGISRRFQFLNDRYECPFAKQVIYLIHRHYLTVTKKTGEKEAEKKNILFYFYRSTPSKEIPKISNQLEFWQDVWDSIKAKGEKRNLKRQLTQPGPNDREPTTPVGKGNQ
jgi:hypothetical protein